MIRFVLTLALLGSSSAFAAPAPTWSKKMVDDLKTKTLQQTFCDNSPGLQTKAACDYFGKDKKELSKKLISVGAQGNVLTLSDGKLTVEIKRLKDELQFEVNRKLIDVGELRVPAKLAAALAKALPKVAVGSLWMNSAFADDSFANYATMVDASAHILSFAVDESTCGYVAKFVDVCFQGVSEYPKAKDMAETEANVAGKVPLHVREQDWYKEKQMDVVTLISRMKSVTRGLASKKSALKVCKDSDGNDGSKYLDACLQSLKKAHFEYRDKTCKIGFEKTVDCEKAKANINKFDIEADAEAKRIEQQSQGSSAVK